HHDAWVNGADDPVSGMVATMEEARAIGELAKTGWRPKRTIVYAAWDGEEPGLLGSTEWAETHADLLRRHAAVYINSDSNGRGFLNVGGSHTLEKFVNEVARDVTDPQKNISVYERARALRIIEGSADERREARERADLRISALGSGSDYTPFLDHLGIASLNIAFGGEDGGGSYHSVYDSFDHYTRFGDPQFDYGVALAKVGGRLVLRLASADVLPFEFTNFTDTVAQYVREVTKLADDAREEIAERNRRVAERSFEAVFDPTERYVQPKPEAPAPYLNFAPLQNALARLQASTRAYQSATSRLGAQNRTLSRETITRLDEALMRTERVMTRAEGLPRRPWFKHHIYAPGFYTGYGVKTLPGVREAIEQRDWKEAGEQIVIVAGVIESVAAEIERAASLAQSTP
ncbi:MAG TPA: transferrin receptor-like dimerization domain-containing protein, partial [Pyrinomonadaceae bacterium]|nr:transferrin receptor-like dimerization domain-containing protein [Pyrinomonadaceae bacterium]